MTKIISGFKNALTGEKYQIGASGGSGTTDPAIVEQIYTDLRSEIANGDANLDGKIEQLNTNLRNEIERNEIPLYTDKTIEEVTELLGDDVHVGKTVAVVENDRVVEYCWQPALSESIRFFNADLGEEVVATRSIENDIKGEFDSTLIAWTTTVGSMYYTTPSEKSVYIIAGGDMTIEVASSYSIMKTSGFVRKTVFYYENESAVAYINGKEVMRITSDGSLRLSDGNGFTATISPRQLAALVATIN